MSSSFEFEGKNVDKAVEIACKELNLSKDQIRFDVLSHGSSGIFGIVGVKKARIRVSVPDAPQTIKADNKKKFLKDPPPEDEADPDSDESGDFSDDEEDQTPYSQDTLSDIPEEALDKGMEILRQIVNEITSDATVVMQKHPDRILFLVNGGNSGTLIGRHGQNLESIQYLIDKIINKRTDHRVRVQLDIEGYVENRLNNLKSMALRLAEKAKKSGKPVTVGQLNAHDRRIVHIALKDDNSVRTQSTGEGQHRRLVVYPKKTSSKKRK